MARKCWVLKTQRKPRFQVRTVRRCSQCGRSRAVYRKFKLCRICFRNLAHQGVLPGVKKSSW